MTDALKPDLEHPRMSGVEKALLLRELRKAKAYQEFGMGGSSLLAVREHVEQIVTVDSDPAWVASVKSHPEIAPRCIDGTLIALHADIGPVREWGYPLDRTHIDKWPKYISAAWQAWGKLGKLPDLVFVDGRFRVACCFSVALVCSRSNDHPVRVLLHDLSDERRHYLNALDGLEIMETAESMLLMRPRKDFKPASGIHWLIENLFDSR